MGVVEAILAFIGLTTIIVVALGFRRRPPTTPPEEDVVAPYREGLHAAVRLQRAAQDLEAQIYAEAANRINPPPRPPQR